MTTNYKACLERMTKQPTVNNPLEPVVSLCFTRITETGKSAIRFNYMLLPYIWIRVPRFLAKIASNSDLFIDTRLARKTN